ncbi:hypothetical protein HK101_004783 [Irineochytrium annulatum]|nr:hypothetical protein HK101_004783 [Irineochytrium annulatum]
MIASSLILAATASLIAPGVLADFTSPYASYSAVLADPNTAQITVKSTLASTKWVGLGLTGQDDPGMGGADLFLFYTLDGSTVTLQHQSGIKGGEDGLADAFANDPATLDVGMSSYANGVLTAVFTRPLTAGNITIPQQGFFLWAMGDLVNGKPVQHTDKSVTSGTASLFATLPATMGGSMTMPMSTPVQSTGAPASSGKPATTTAKVTTPSRADRSVAFGGVAAFVALLAHLL